MSAQEDRGKLNQTIQNLKSRFDGVDFTAINNPKAIMKYLDEIDDVYIQVQQYKSRRGVDDWLSWGHNLWGDIERNKAALERNLNRIERDNTKHLHKFDRKMSLLSLLFVAIATISAAVSAYYAYRSFDKASIEKTEIQNVDKNKSSKSPQIPLNKQIQPTPKSGAAD